MITAWFLFTLNCMGTCMWIQSGPYDTQELCEGQRMDDGPHWKCVERHVKVPPLPK